MTTIIIPKVECQKRYRLLDGKEVEVLRIQTFPDQATHDVRTTCTVTVTGGDEWQIGRQLTFDRPALAAQIVEELPVDA